MTSKSKTKFYWESVGEVVSQVYEIEDVNDFKEAKRKAFPDMDEGDFIALCKPNDVLWNTPYDGYATLDEDECEEYAKLEKGAWSIDSNGKEIWLENAWYWSDDPETLYDGDYELI